MSQDGFPEDFGLPRPLRIVRGNSAGSTGAQTTMWTQVQDEAGNKAENLFVGGPPMGLQRYLGLIELSRRSTPKRAVLTTFICWLPLMIMTLAQDLTIGDGSFFSFLSDFGAQARYLVAVPLLVLADAVCSPSLGRLIAQFRNSGLLAGTDILRLDRRIDAMIPLRDSLRFEAGLLVLAFIIAGTLRYELPPIALPKWNYYSIGAITIYTVAGWWQVLVSIPILIMLILGWLWRLGLWTRLLILISRLQLNLIASHPDQCGGLKFIGLSLESFSIVVFGFSVVVAGTVANRVIHDGLPLTEFQYAIGVFVVLVLILFAGPLFAFSLKLLATRRHGIVSYGALAQGMGSTFEREWLDGNAPGADALKANDFSSTTDLYSVASNVYSMNVVPISLTNLAVFLVTALLPFVPVLLLSVPIDLLLQRFSHLFI